MLFIINLRTTEEPRVSLFLAYVLTELRHTDGFPPGTASYLTTSLRIAEARPNTTKSTYVVEVVNYLRKQLLVFGNSCRIISDRRTTFTSNVFKEHCIEENVRHHFITTGISRDNRQVKRMNRTLVQLLTKL